jgi:transcriptional regulator with XRE-family HTH domain
MNSSLSIAFSEFNKIYLIFRTQGCIMRIHNRKKGGEYMNIGEKIRAARLAKGMTQEELGAILGVQKSAIAKYENGRIVNIKRSTLKKISDVLGIRPSELIYEKIEQNPVGMAELHFEMIEDVDLSDLFQDFKLLDARERKIVKDLAHSLAETKKADV